MVKIRIKSGQQVKIIAGKDKGKTGKVLQVFPRLGRIVVEGVNVSKRHLKTRRSGQKGQTVEFFMPIHVSNIQPLGDDGKTMRHDKIARGKVGKSNA